MTQEPARMCASRYFSGRLSTTVATMGETAAQPIVVAPQAPSLVMPERLLSHFQCQSFKAKKAAVEAAPTPIETARRRLLTCLRLPASAACAVKAKAAMTAAKIASFRFIPCLPSDAVPKFCEPPEFASRARRRNEPGLF